MEPQTISLTTKPGASLHISALFPDLTKDSPLRNILMVFLNGLILPRSLWSDSIDHLLKIRTDANSNSHLPTGLLTYDRFGQGDSDPDPADPPDTPYGHDARTVVADLHQLLSQISQDRLNRPLEELSLVFVCNSIGCPLARIYTATYPGTVLGLLFLDSMMANSDFVDSLFPDPDDDGSFDSGNLPEDISVEDIRYARERFRTFFHPTATNPERFDRRNLAELLPFADGPPLPRVLGGRRPRVVVVGHDPDTFATQCEEGSLSVPKRVINAYVNPAWSKYNKGLTKLGFHKTRDGEGEGGDNGVQIAKGCGHFIQRDDPMIVAKEICGLLDYLS